MGKFITRRDYPKFVIQEMIVNACCHRAYNIKGTEIQIKMFDDRIVFESPGRLPGMVRPSNIRHTHFSRNPKIAAFLKVYHFVKEYGEGVDRIYRELEVNGAVDPKFHTDDFILKVTVHNAVNESSIKVTEKVTEKLREIENKAIKLGEKLTENRRLILRMILEDPYITKVELSKAIGISYTSVSRNIEAMRGKYIRRIGADKGGFWEILR